MDGITTIFTNLQAQLVTLVIPVAVIAIVLWFILNALAPMIPEGGQMVRGHLQRVLLGVAIAGFATTIVTALYSLGGGA